MEKNCEILIIDFQQTTSLKKNHTAYINIDKQFHLAIQHTLYYYD